jgi:hypothetical protein
MPASFAISSERFRKNSWSSMASGFFSRSRPVCMTVMPAPVSAASAASAGSRCKPQTSLTIWAPALMASRAVSAR